MAGNEMSGDTNLLEHIVVAGFSEKMRELLEDELGGIGDQRSSSLPLRE